MSDSEENITPFRLPAPGSSEPRETFGERLRRRRQELSSGPTPDAPVSWQTRSKTLVALVVTSPHASASIANKNADVARTIDGVAAVLFSSDIPPFKNTLGELFSGEPLLAEDEVVYCGQPVALVIARDELSCREAAEQIEIEYHRSPPIANLEHAVEMKHFHGEARECSRGDAKKAIKSAPKTLKGQLTIPSQRVFPPYGDGIRVRPLPGGAGVSVAAPALLPTSVRRVVAIAADLPESEIHLESVSLPGTTGALETEPIRLAALAAHAMVRCGSEVVLKLPPSDATLHSGCRHEAIAGFTVGFDRDGLIQGIDLALTLDGGWYLGDSETALDRAVLHADGVYGIPDLSIKSQLAKTNRKVTTAISAEGSAQGAWAIEEIIQRVAEAVGVAPHLIREKNFYQEDNAIATAPYGQPVSAKSISRVWQQVLRASDFDYRREAIDQWNRSHAGCKRGIAITPMKFGIGDPRADRNAAAVIVQILGDGSINVRAGLVDTNDGLADQIREEVAHRLGVDEKAIRVILNDFDALPRATSVIGTDASGLVLRAIDEACRSLVKRLQEVALQLFAARGQTEIELESIRFMDGVAGPDISPTSPLHFKEVVEGAWRKRVNLIETGYHRTPNLWWDPDLGAGWPFSSFTYAAAVTELEVDAFTGEVQILRVDLAHEGSPSTNQADRDFAQLVKSFNLGASWILQDAGDDGIREGGSPNSRYRLGVPGFGDAPHEFITNRLRPLGDALSVAGDPCGEAPVLLASSVREAYRDALSSFGMHPGLAVKVPFPATPPATLTTLREISLALRDQDEKKAKDKPDAPAQSA